jgi:putative Flp pilus-assembly TadE/G-like protein
VHVLTRVRKLRLHKRLSTRDDRGAVATVFAILLAGGVLLGLLALVVDVGQVYVERGELQSGADAAALAVARACASNAPECRDYDQVRILAQRYADENSSDGVSKLDQVCGFLPGILPACPAPNPNLTACLGDEPRIGNWVEVRLLTELPDGQLVLPPVFAQATASGFDGVSVGACGRAGWQVRLDVPLLGIAVSMCDFQRARLGRSLTIGDASRLGCAADQVGAVLDNPDPRCEVELPETAIIGGHLIVDLRLPIGGDCKKRLHQAISDGTVVYLPVYDVVGGNSFDPTFHIVGALGVTVTGYLDRTDPDPPPDIGPPTTDGRCDVESVSRCISFDVVSKIGPFALVGRSTLGLIG